jgi:ABC-type Fe3+ transport system substrate-binding protein
MCFAAFILARNRGRQRSSGLGVGKTSDRNRSFFAILTLLTLVVAACSDGSASPAATAGVTASAGRSSADLTEAGLLAAAKKEGSVTVYLVAAVYEPLLNGFKAKYGIDVNNFRGATGPVQAKIDGELLSGVVLADVIDLAGVKAVMDGYVRNDHLAEIGDLPAAKSFPKEWITKNYAFVQLLHYELVYNTNKIREGEIKTWTDAVNPKWTGQMAAIDPSISPTAQGTYLFLQEKLGDDFIRKFADLKPTLYGAAGTAAQAVAAGEKSIGLMIISSVLAPLKSTKAPIASIAMNPTTGVWHYAAVLKKAAHPNAARLFMNYLLSPEGQTQFNAQGSGASPLAGLRDVAVVPNTYQPINEDYPAAQRARIMQLLGLAK